MLNAVMLSVALLYVVAPKNITSRMKNISAADIEQRILML
jgi:hypothetical protein